VRSSVVIVLALSLLVYMGTRWTRDPATPEGDAPALNSDASRRGDTVITLEQERKGVQPSFLPALIFR
jgi:hypothetical protein